MKACIAIIATLLFSVMFAGDAQSDPGPAANAGTHRYLVERTFPAGALEGLNPALKAKVNANNAKYGVHWLMSYANADKDRKSVV